MWAHAGRIGSDKLAGQEAARQSGEGIAKLKTKRQLLERAITTAVTREMAQDRTVDVTAMAIRLSSRYPQSGIALDAICGKIEAVVAATLEESGKEPPPVPAG